MRVLGGTDNVYGKVAGVFQQTVARSFYEKNWRVFPWEIHRTKWWMIQRSYLKILVLTYLEEGVVLHSLVTSLVSSSRFIDYFC